MRISDWSSDVCSSDLALVEQRGFGRILRFWLAVADDAAAERDHAAARVADRDHQAAAEAIRGFLALDPDQQAGFDEHRIAVILERGLEFSARIGGKAEAERLGDRG